MNISPRNDDPLREYVKIMTLAVSFVYSSLCFLLSNCSRLIGNSVDVVSFDVGVLFVYTSSVY